MSPSPVLRQCHVLADLKNSPLPRVPFSLRLRDLGQTVVLCPASCIKGLLEVRELEVSVSERVCVPEAVSPSIETRPLTQRRTSQRVSVTPEHSVAMGVVFLIGEIIIRDGVFLGKTSF